MKNKKLLAMALLPLGLTQTISAWWATPEIKNIIIELLKHEKVPELRRSNERHSINYQLKDEF